MGSVNVCSKAIRRGQSIESIENARPEVRASLDQAQRFLRLAALLAVILAAVAVGLSARRFMQRHLDACAVMRCLGAAQAQVLTIVVGEFVLFGAIVRPLGVALSTVILIVVASAASSEFRPRESLLAGLLLAALAVGVFVVGLQLQLPIWPLQR